MSKNKGPIKILCDEIGAEYYESLESSTVLVWFVATLVDEVELMMGSARQIAHLTGDEPSKNALNAVTAVKALLEIEGAEELIKASAKIHPVVSVPDEGPCDHYIDMLSSCVSALRFGLETPCKSRHAAAAAGHIWKRRYGVMLFDKHSNKWGKQWARSKFYESLGKLVETAQEEL